MNVRTSIDTATVVIGIDDSGQSLRALHWGCGEARRLRGRAVAVLFAGTPAGVGTALSTVAGWLAMGFAVPEPAGSEQLEGPTAELLREAADLDLHVVHAVGNQVTELRRVAAEVRADLVVISGSMARPRGLVGAGRLRVMARPHSPVIVVVP